MRTNNVVVTKHKQRTDESDEWIRTSEICSPLCRDTWSKIVEFCDTREWFQLSYTCKGINKFKFNQCLMIDKVRTLKRTLNDKEIDHWFQLGKGMLFNVNLNGCPAVVDEHFQYLEGIHTLNMVDCENITDDAFSHLIGIHTLNMRNCQHITDNAFTHLTGIHTLSMSFCKKITDSAFIHLAGIHTLDMSCCKKISDNAFPHLAGIHTLLMTRCVQITDSALVHLTGIHTLNMSGCTQITDKAFVCLTGIQTLEMNGCNQDSLTEKALLQLEGVRKLSWFGRRNEFTREVIDYTKPSSIRVVQPITYYAGQRLNRSQ